MADSQPSVDGGEEKTKTVLTLNTSKKRPAAAAAFGDEEEKSKDKKGDRGEEIRDLNDRKEKIAKVIPMKEGTAWHKGRLGKDSNAEKLIEMHKSGMSISLEMAKLEEERQKPKGGANIKLEDEEGSTLEEKARRALEKEALAAQSGGGPDPEESTLGLTIKTGNSTGRALTDEDALKQDLEKCGKETQLDDYEDMPISEFGKALMRGMGWKDGEALGGSRKGILEPVEIRAQPDMLGLGAVPKQPSPPKDSGRRRHVPKPGEARDHREADKDRIRKEAQERLGLMEVGTKVSIIGGRHRGLVGVISYRYAHEIMVRLDVSAEEVTVDKKDLDTDVSKAKGIKTRDEEQAEEREKDKKRDRDRERDRESDDRRGKDRRDSDYHKDRDRDSRRDSGSSHRDERDRKQDKNKPSWLHPNIRVRIVDQSFKEGKFYLKKGHITDVFARGLCTVMTDEGKMLEVSEKQLETVLPKEGGMVLILLGELKNRRGRLMKKDKSKETATIQMAGDMRLEIVSMDDIAEFVGQSNDLIDY